MKEKNLEVFLLLNFLEEEITKNQSFNYDEISTKFLKKLEEKQIISLGSSKVKNKLPKVEYWLKSRIYEHIITYHGLKEYLSDILNGKSKNPEKEIGFNGYFLMMYLLASNKDDLSNKIFKNKKIKFSNIEKEIIEYIFKTPRDFELNLGNYKFQPFKISEIRANISNFMILDDYFTNKNIPEIKIPNDLKLGREINNIPTINDFLSITKKYNNLNIFLIKDYIVFYNSKRPIIYLKDLKLMYSHKDIINNNFSDNEVSSQIEFIYDNFFEKKIKPFCSMCKQKQVKYIAHNNVQTIGICEKCIDNAKRNNLQINEISFNE